MDNATRLLAQLNYFVDAIIVGVIVFIIVLMLVRLALNYADLNPFSRPVLLVRGWTDPYLNGVRRGLLGFGFNPNIAPLVLILIAILFGWLAVQLADSLFTTLINALIAAHAGRPVVLVGVLLFGALSIYLLMIFTRIILSWGQVGYGNRLMRFLVNATEPLLGPLRRIIPPLGGFDISALVAFFIIRLFQAAIQGTLMRF
ncbi:MAG: YggT family protein [Pyrinomonadaceae bacterium]